MTVLAETPQEERGDFLQQSDQTWQMTVVLRRVLLLVPPFLLATLEVLHLQPDETPQTLMDVATWSAGFHGIQLALAGLVGLSVMLLADEFGARTPG